VGYEYFKTTHGRGYLSLHCEVLVLHGATVSMPAISMSHCIYPRYGSVLCSTGVGLWVNLWQYRVRSDGAGVGAKLLESTSIP